jgi:hypothetical protein
LKLFERLKGFQPLAPYLVIVFFIISIGFSSMPSEPAVLAAWLVTGLIGIIFIRVAFPRSYLYGLWLLVIYILAGVGVMFFNGVGLTGSQGIGVGILLEIVALYILYHLVFQVKGLRDIGEGPYVPLGLWSMAVFLFFVFSNGAFASLVRWSMIGGKLGGYIGFEVLLVLMVVFILVKAEQCVLYLEEGPKALRRTRGVKAKRRVIAVGRSKVGRRAKADSRKKARSKKAADVGSCPICGSRLRIVDRVCPECDNLEKTAVCSKNGHLFLPCPSCGKANFHGDYRCKNCNSKLKGSILCRECGLESDLHEWAPKERRGRSKK